MTDSERQQLKQFEARVRQLLLQYKTLQAENQQLAQQVADQQAQVDVLNQQLGQLQLDYKTLKTARMIEVSDVDMKNAKQTITQLVREVNKCIGLLSAEQYLGEEQSGPATDADNDAQSQQDIDLQTQTESVPQPDEGPVFLIEPEPILQPVEVTPVQQPKPQPEIEELTLPFE